MRSLSLFMITIHRKSKTSPQKTYFTGKFNGPPQLRSLPYLLPSRDTHHRHAVACFRINTLLARPKLSMPSPSPPRREIRAENLTIEFDGLREIRGCQNSPGCQPTDILILRFARCGTLQYVRDALTQSQPMALGGQD